MKKTILLYLSSLLLVSSSFGLTPSANIIFNSSADQYTWWGTGLVLARRWDRAPADNLFCRTTTDGYNSDGALYILQSPTISTTRWATGLRVAVEPGMTYQASLYAKWANSTVSNSIGMVAEIFDNTISPTLVQSTLVLSTTGSSGGQWVKLTGSFTVPSNGNAATFLIGTFGANTETWVIFDDIKVWTSGSPNLLINPGFESLDTTAPASLWPSYWRRNTSSPHFFWTTSTAHSGSASVYAQHSTGLLGYRMWYNAQGATRSVVPIDPNRKYKYGGRMLWQDILNGAVGIGLQWFNAQDSTLNTVSVSTHTLAGDLAEPPIDESIILTGDDPGTWVYVVNTATPPVDARWARVILWNASTSAAHQQIAIFDDVFIRSLPIELDVSPKTISVTIGKDQQFIVSGGTMPYTFTSSDITVGTINQTGLFTALNLGVTTITAKDADGFTGQANVTVIATSAPLHLDRAEYISIREEIK